TEVVSGGEEAGEQDKITLHSHDQIDEIVNLVKATIDEKKPDLVVPGQQISPDDFVVRIASSVEAQAENKNWRVKSLPEQLPKTLKSGLFDFAIKLNKTVHDLTPEDLEAFKEFEVPEIIKNHTKVVSPGALAVVKDLRAKLETSLKQEFMENSIEKIMDSVNTPEDVARVRTLLRSTLKSSLDENFQLSEKESISKEEQDILVKTLSVSLAEEEPKIRAIVTN